MSSRPFVPPINAAQTLIRASGSGAESAFQTGNYDVDPHSGFSRQESALGVGKGCWEVRGVVSGGQGSFACVALRSLYNTADSAAGVKLVISATPAMPRACFPTACIISVCSVGRIQDAVHLSDVQVKDVVVKEWIMDQRSVDPDGGDAAGCGTMRCHVSLKTILNVASLLSSSGECRAASVTAAPRLFLALRFVGCCDTSDTHRFRKVMLAYVPSVGGTASSCGSSSRGREGSLSVGREASPSGHTVVDSSRAWSIPGGGASATSRNGGSCGINHNDKGANADNLVELVIDCTQSPPPASRAPSRRAPSAPSTASLSPLSTADGDDEPSALQLGRRSFSPREPSMLRTGATMVVDEAAFEREATNKCPPTAPTPARQPRWRGAGDISQRRREEEPRDSARAASLQAAYRGVGFSDFYDNDDNDKQQQQQQRQNLDESGGVGDSFIVIDTAVCTPTPTTRTRSKHQLHQHGEGNKTHQTGPSWMQSRGGGGGFDADEEGEMIEIATSPCVGAPLWKKDTRVAPVHSPAPRYPAPSSDILHPQHSAREEREDQRITAPPRAPSLNVYDESDIDDGDRGGGILGDGHPRQSHPQKRVDHRAAVTTTINMGSASPPAASYEEPRWDAEEQEEEQHLHSINGPCRSPSGPNDSMPSRETLMHRIARTSQKIFQQVRQGNSSSSSSVAVSDADAPYRASESGGQANAHDALPPPPPPAPPLPLQHAHGGHWIDAPLPPQSNQGLEARTLLPQQQQQQQQQQPEQGPRFARVSTADGGKGIYFPLVPTHIPTRTSFTKVATRAEEEAVERASGRSASPFFFSALPSPAASIAEGAGTESTLQSHVRQSYCTSGGEASAGAAVRSSSSDNNSSFTLGANHFRPFASSAVPDGRSAPAPVAAASDADRCHELLTEIGAVLDIPTPIMSRSSTPVEMQTHAPLPNAAHSQVRSTSAISGVSVFVREEPSPAPAPSSSGGSGSIALPRRLGGSERFQPPSRSTSSAAGSGASDAARAVHTRLSSAPLAVRDPNGNGHCNGPVFNGSNSGSDADGGSNAGRRNAPEQGSWVRTGGTRAGVSAMGCAPASRPRQCAGSVSAALPCDSASCVVWCDKHHATRAGTAARLLQLQLVADGGCVITVRKPDGSATCKGAGDGPHDTHFPIPAAELEVLVGLAAFGDRAIHRAKVSCANHCIVLRRRRFPHHHGHFSGHAPGSCGNGNAGVETILAAEINSSAEFGQLSAVLAELAQRRT